MDSVSAVHVIEDPARAATALHPLRLKLLGLLRQPDSAAGLARRTGLARQKLNYHLHELERDGLVEQVGERKKRNCTERMIRAVAQAFVINPAALGEVAPDPRVVRDHASSAYMVAVAARTIREVAALKQAAAQSKKRLSTLTLQSDVRFSSPADQRSFAKEFSEIMAKLIAKYHDETATAGRTFRVTAGAYPVPPGVGTEGGNNDCASS